MQYTKHGIEFTKPEIKAIATYASRDATRFRLNGVFLELVDDKTIRAVATDGRRLAILEGERTPESRSFEPVIVPLDSLTQAAKSLSRKTHRLRVTVDGTEIALAAVDIPGKPRGFSRDSCDLPTTPLATLTVKAIDYQFPLYRQVVPAHTGNGRTGTRDGAPVPTWGVNLDYLDALTLVRKAMDSVGESDPGAIVITPYAELEPLVVIAGRYSRWTVVIMPMRIVGDLARNFGEQNDLAKEKAKKAAQVKAI